MQWKKKKGKNKMYQKKKIHENVIGSWIKKFVYKGWKDK